MIFIIRFGSTNTNCTNNLNRFCISDDLINPNSHYEDTHLLWRNFRGRAICFHFRDRYLRHPRRNSFESKYFLRLFVFILDLLCPVLLPLSYAPSLNRVHRSVVSSETFALKVHHLFLVGSNNWTFANSLLSNHRSNALKRNTYEISLSLILYIVIWFSVYTIYKYVHTA